MQAQLAQIAKIAALKIRTERSDMMVSKNVVSATSEVMYAT
jgi:hypothetical protein